MAADALGAIGDVRAIPELIKVLNDKSDEVAQASADALAGRNDFGGSGAVSKILSECACPIIVTASDVWDKKMSGIRTECEIVELKKASKPVIRKLLTHISVAEKIVASPELIDKISDGCAGDVRAAINDLQALSSGERDREKDIFNRIRSIFKAKDYKEAASGDIDYETIKLWVDENISNEYIKKDDLALAFNWLSRSDIFDGRIRKSNWKYLKYAIDLSTVGVSLAKSEPYRSFTKYSFPSYLREMSRSIARRAMLKSIGLKIGKKVHSNRKEALDYVPLIRDLGKEYPEAVANYYEFEEEELAFIMETSPGKVRAKKDRKRLRFQYRNIRQPNKKEGNEKKSV